MVNLLNLFFLIHLLNPTLILKKNKTKPLKRYIIFKGLVSTLYIFILDYYCIFQLGLLFKVLFLILPICISYIIDHILYKENNYLRYMSNISSIIILVIAIFVIYYPIIKTRIIYKNISISYIDKLNNSNILKQDKDTSILIFKNYIEKENIKYNKNLYVKNVYNDIIKDKLIWQAEVFEKDILNQILIINEEDKIKSISTDDFLLLTQRDVKQLIYKSFPFYQLKDFIVQFDNEFNPFYIVPYYDNTKVDGVFIVNPITTEYEKYELSELPEFINFILNENLILPDLKSYTKQKNGIINILKSNLQISDFDEKGLSSIFIDNKKYWLIDIYNDEVLTSQILLIDSINQDILSINDKIYNSIVFNDSIDRFKNSTDMITSPILYNIYNGYLWIGKIITQQGTIKGYIAMYGKSGEVLTAYDINSLLYNYKLILQMEKILGNYSGNETVTSKKGYVERINFINNDIGLICVIKLYDDNNLYVANTFINKDLLITSEKDYIKVFYEINSDGIIVLNNIINYNTQ